MLAALISSSSGVGFLFGSKAFWIPIGSLDRYFSVTLRSLQNDARLPLRLRKCRIFGGTLSKSVLPHGVLGRELKFPEALFEHVRSTDSDLHDEDAAVFNIIRQL